MRKHPLVEGEIYHILNKSIAKYVIFNSRDEYLRMMNVIRYYQTFKSGDSFSRYIQHPEINYEIEQSDGWLPLDPPKDKEKLVEIIAYCLMPTHMHFILKQLKENGISVFMSNIQNSYCRYFNLKHERKGPLWVGRFKSILAESEEYLYSLSRYIHLNPVTGYHVNKPQDWLASSYNEYLKPKRIDRITHFEDTLEIEPVGYRKFVDDRISFQRDLAKIKHLLME